MSESLVTQILGAHARDLSFMQSQSLLHGTEHLRSARPFCPAVHGETHFSCWETCASPQCAARLLARETPLSHNPNEDDMLPIECVKSLMGSEGFSSGFPCHGVHI